MGLNKKYERIKSNDLFRCIKCNNLFSDHDIVSIRPTGDNYSYFICSHCWVNYYPNEVKSWVKFFPNDKNRFDVIKLKLRQTKIERIKDGI